MTWPLCAPSCPLLEESMLSSFRGCAAPPRVAAKTAGNKRALLAAMGAQLTWIKARHVPCPCRVYRQLLLRGLRCRERSMPRVASTDTTQHPRFGAVSLRPIKPVGSSENGLSVAAAAYQAGGRPLISAGSCAEGTCRPLLCPSQARAGRPPLPLPPKKQSAGLPRSASSLSLGKAGGFRTTRPVSRGA